MLKCLGTLFQRILKASEMIKSCRQRKGQTPTELLAYLEPLWDEAEVDDSSQQVMDYLTALDPSLKKQMALVITTNDLTLTQAEEHANNFYQAVKGSDKGHQTQQTSQAKGRKSDNHDHVKSLRPKKKLDNKFMGPGFILSQKGPDVYEVHLSALRGAHPVFHASLLEKWEPNGSLALPNSQELDTMERFGDEDRQIDEVLDRRRNATDGWEYLVKWRNLPDDENSWETGPQIPPEVLNKFWQKTKVVGQRRTKGARGRASERGEPTLISLKNSQNSVREL
jgi:hypothetical protein